MKFILSDSEYSYYRYGDYDFPSYCRGNNFPKFFNGQHWVEVRSFLKFADNAVEVDEATFLEDLKKAGGTFEKE